MNSESSSDSDENIKEKQLRKQMKLCNVLLERVQLSRNDIKDNSSPRRGSRNRATPRKYEDFQTTTSGRRKRNLSISETSDSSMDDETTSSPKKPTELFDTSDVDGHDIFKFKSRHTKHDLQNKVLSAISTPKNITPLTTPKKGRLSVVRNEATETTPRAVNKKIKKRIITEVESESSDGDFSGTSSDFVPDESDKDSASSASSDASDNEETMPKTPAKIEISKTSNRKVKSAQNSDFVFSSDNYFLMNSSKKITTSDHTLERLKNFEHTNNYDDSYLSSEHKTKLKDLAKSYEPLFSKWILDFDTDYNVIVYGVGSKRLILEEFRNCRLKNFPTIVVNGFFPSLTIKSITDAILVDVLNCKQIPSNMRDMIALIDKELTDMDLDVFLIIHNIDGVMLRNAKCQEVITNLASIKNIHVLASIDHINAALLWDQSRVCKLNFTWWDVTTLSPYIVELSYENSLLTYRQGSLQLSSLGSVYQSLTSNAKGIFRIIIQNQLDNKKHPHYQGLPFKELYSKCREQFLVSSDVALRAQLTEFLDHKLVKMKRTIDGSENLNIPIENGLLQQFLDSQIS